MAKEETRREDVGRPVNPRKREGPHDDRRLPHTREDTRQQPHEERELAYEIPAEGVVLVRGELFYNLLWPSLVEKFSQLPTELADPVTIAEHEETLSEE